MHRLNNIPLWTVPPFLVILVLLLGVGSCSRIFPEGEQAGYSEEEQFYIEGYLRLIEARGMALRGDSLADGRYEFLRQDLPADSLRAIARGISENTPQRWHLIYEEIIRRKQILENEPR